MAKCSRVGVPVDGDDTIAAVRRERVTDEKACARFANASLSRDDRDLATANDLRLDPRDQFTLPDLLRSRAHRDEPAREGEDRPAPTGGWGVGSGSNHALGCEISGAQMH